MRRKVKARYNILKKQEQWDRKDQEIPLWERSCDYEEDRLKDLIDCRSLYSVCFHYPNQSIITVLGEHVHVFVQIMSMHSCSSMSMLVCVARDSVEMLVLRRKRIMYRHVQSFSVQC